jgi:FkbM family methyltransferase
MKIGLARLGNSIYEVAPGIYRPIYSAYKALADRRERAQFASWIRPGDSVLDIGANIGVYTQFFARLVGPNGRVFAFEPEPTNVRMLRQASEKLPQVQIEGAAVSEVSGHLKLFVSPDMNVDHRTFDSGDQRDGIVVPSVALDEFVPDDIHVTAIKIDIQGAELKALRGAERLLRESKRLLMILEYWPYGLRAAGEDPLALLALLRDLGFELKTVGANPLPSPEGVDFFQYVNLIAVKR